MSSDDLAISIRDLSESNRFFNVPSDGEKRLPIGNHIRVAGYLSLLRRGKA